MRRVNFSMTSIDVLNGCSSILIILTLTTDEIADQYFNLKAEAEKVCFFGDDMNIAPRKSDIEYANQETAAYLKSNYNV